MQDGDRVALNQVAEAVYAEMKRRAAGILHQERPGHSLQATLLVNEAFMRLVSGQPVDFADRDHFYTLASRTMRRVVTDYYRKSKAEKRPPKQLKVDLDKLDVFDESQRDEVMMIDEALTELAGVRVRTAQALELYYYLGLGVQEIAPVLNVSQKTVQRDLAGGAKWMKLWFGVRTGDGEPSAESAES